MSCPASHSSGLVNPHSLPGVSQRHRSAVGAALPLTELTSSSARRQTVRRNMKHSESRSLFSSPRRSCWLGADGAGLTEPLWRACRVSCCSSRAPLVGRTDCSPKAWRGLCWYFLNWHGDWELDFLTSISLPRWHLTSDYRWGEFPLVSWVNLFVSSWLKRPVWVFN